MMKTLTIDDLTNDLRIIRDFAEQQLSETDAAAVQFRVRYTRGDQERPRRYSSADTVTVDRDGQIS